MCLQTSIRFCIYRIESTIVEIRMCLQTMAIHTRHVITIYNSRNQNVSLDITWYSSRLTPSTIVEIRMCLQTPEELSRFELSTIVEIRMCLQTRDAFNCDDLIYNSRNQNVSLDNLTSLVNILYLQQQKLECVFRHTTASVSELPIYNSRNQNVSLDVFNRCAKDSNLQQQKLECVFRPG